MVTKVTTAITNNIKKRITRFHVEAHRAVPSSPTEKAIDLELEPRNFFVAAKTLFFFKIFTQISTMIANSEGSANDW